MERKELYNRCVLGDRNAQGILYSTYRDGMRRVVFGVLGDVPEVDDVLHDGFLIIFSTIANVHDPERLPAWMATLMRRLAVKVRQDSNRLCPVNIDDELNSVAAAEEDDEPDSFGWEKLSELIDRLPDGYGRVFRLAVLDGMTHKEIGNLLGINERSSSSQLFRAKKLLRRFIIEYRNALVIFVTMFTVGVLMLLLKKNCYEKNSTYRRNRAVGSGIGSRVSVTAQRLYARKNRVGYRSAFSRSA